MGRSYSALVYRLLRRRWFCRSGPAGKIREVLLHCEPNRLPACIAVQDNLIAGIALQRALITSPREVLRLSPAQKSVELTTDVGEVDVRRRRCRHIPDARDSSAFMLNFYGMAHLELGT